MVSCSTKDLDYTTQKFQVRQGVFVEKQNTSNVIIKSVKVTKEFTAIEMIADKCIIDQLVDWFGKDIKFTELNENQIKVELVASPLAMENWAMQFVKHVEVIKPVSLRESLKEFIDSAQDKYK